VRYRTLQPLATILLVALLTACSGTLQPPPAPTPIEASEGTLDLSGVGDEQASFEIRNIGGVTLSWTLSIAYDPDGTNPDDAPWFSASPTAGELEPGASQVLTLTLTPGRPEGSFRAVLTLSYPGGSTGFEVLAQVGDGPPPAEGFRLDLSPDDVTLAPGQRGEALLTVTSDSGDGVSLDVEVPAGLTADLSAAAPGQALLEVTVANGTPSGTLDVTVVGVRGSETARATLTVTVVAGDPDPGSARIVGTLVTANAELDVVPPTGPVAAPLRAAPGDRPLYLPDQLLVRYREGGGEEGALSLQAETVRRSVSNAFGLTPLRSRGPGRAELVRLPDGSDVTAAARELMRDPRILYAEPNWLLWPATLPNDPLLADAWQLPLIGAPLGWELRDGAGVTVAVIDTGIDLDHPDLQGTFVSVGYDFCDDAVCSRRDADPRPVTGDVHGTHVTGLLAAVGDNGLGGVGVLQGGARILPVKVFSDYPAATTADALADAILWAAGLPVSGAPANLHPADILNLSLGTSPNVDTGSADFATLREAVEAAQAAGALLVAAAGNGGLDDVGYPAAFPGVISVGAVRSDLTRPCYANASRDPAVQARHLVAPGGTRAAACPGEADELLLSTLPGGGHGLLAGTSQAAPQVSGAAALVWASQSGATAASVRAALLASAYFDPESMVRSDVGSGLLRLDAALGFPGPGDDVTVSAVGSGDSAVASAVLDPFGGSTTFSLEGLDAGSYRVEADAVGRTVPLAGGLEVTLGMGERRPVVVEISP
jgi:serine protease